MSESEVVNENIEKPAEQEEKSKNEMLVEIVSESEVPIEIAEKPTEQEEISAGEMLKLAEIVSEPEIAIEIVEKPTEITETTENNMTETTEVNAIVAEVVVPSTIISTNDELNPETTSNEQLENGTIILQDIKYIYQKFRNKIKEILILFLKKSLRKFKKRMRFWQQNQMKL